MMKTLSLLFCLLHAPPEGTGTGPIATGPFEMLPHPSVFRMANQARAIVEGQAGKGGVVQVTRRWLVRAGDRVADRIEVPALAAMPVVPQPIGGLGGRRPIRPDAVLLFLADNPGGDQWVPMHLIRGRARGVVWLEKQTAWGYAQRLAPGGYSLGRLKVRDDDGVAQLTTAGVREMLAAGLQARRHWAAALAIEDPNQRAAALSVWFSPETSPDGERWRERLWPDLMQASDALGGAIVRPLRRIVQTGDEPDAVVAAAAALQRLGTAAQAATPAFIARLRVPRGVPPIHLLRALRRLADPRAADVLLACLDDEDLFVATEAAAALVAIGSLDGVDRLVARVPRQIDGPAGLGAVAPMLELIHDHRPAVAERLVRERFLDHEQLMMQRPWLRRLRDRR